MKSFGITSVLLLTLFLTSPSAVEAQVLRPSELCSDSPDAAIATFEDADLEAAVRSALSVSARDDLTCGLVSGLTRLEAQRSGIASLVGIQNLTSLTFLSLHENYSITDISGLSGLTSLTVLRLDHNWITDVSALSGLTSVTDLDIFANSITDISPLSGLTSLRFLDLQANSVTDISALRGLTSLMSLNINQNSVTDISALRGLTSLTNLDLWENSIIDVSALSGLTSLTDLDLFANSITDISLSGLTSLTSLRLGDNSITDISLSGLTSLTSLRLNDNLITDISALSGLTGLTELWLSGNSITDVSALSKLTNLTKLYLDDNLITDISPLSGLTSVPYLGLGGNSITDISPLSGLSSLELLRLDDNSITDIGVLRELTSLKYLNLSRNPGLANVQPLLDNPGLGAGHTVFLSGTSVSCTEMARMTGVHVVGIAACSATSAASGLAQITTSVSGTTERIQERSYQFEEAGLRMEYQLFVPTTYDAATPSPLLVLLHGAGFYPGEIIRYQGFTDLAEERGYIVVAPMGYNPWGGYGARSGRISELSERDVMNVLELTLGAFNVDRDRVYLSGHSMGGGGTLHLAIKYPDLWAALGPMAPGGSPSPDALSAITHIPVIMVHGDDDTSVEISRTWVAKMAELGMTHRYIEIPGGDHFSIITSDRDNVQAIFDFFDQARRD